MFNYFPLIFWILLINKCPNPGGRTMYRNYPQKVALAHYSAMDAEKIYFIQIHTKLCKA